MLGVSVRRHTDGKLSTRTTASLRRRLVVGGLVLLSLVLVTVSFRENGDGPLAGAQSAGAAVLRRSRSRRTASRSRSATRTGGQAASSTRARTLRAWNRENELLRQQVAERRLALRENTTLRRLLQYRNGPRFPEGYSGLAAAVISRPAGAYAQAIVIAAGRKDGIRVDDPVVTQDGLVGKVSRVSSRTARVTLLTDDASAASALDVETQAFGIVRSGDGPRAPLRLDRVPKEARVRVGDTVATSGWAPRASPPSTRAASGSDGSRAWGGRTRTSTHRCR